MAVITVPLSTAVLAFLLVTVAMMLVLWFFRDRKRGKEERRMDKTAQDHVLQCPICAHVYVESKPGEMTKCPQCGSMNEEGESSKVVLKRRR